MAIILFNAFSSLQKKLKAQGLPYANVSMHVKDGTTVEELMDEMGICREDVEAAFVNGSVTAFDTILREGDRVAMVLPGTPGPYLVLMGMIQKKKTT